MAKSFAGILTMVVVSMVLSLSLLRAQVVSQDPRQRPASVDCPETASDLYALQQAYESGQFERIAARSECAVQLYEATLPARRPSLELQTVTEKFLHLLVLSQLALHQEDAAETTTVLLLARFPGHAMEPDVDPPQFGLLLDSLIPYAANHFGIVGGINSSLVQVLGPAPLRTDITNGGAVAVGPEFSNRRNLTWGLAWQHHFGYHHSWITGLHVNGLSYATNYASRAFAKNDPHQVGDWTIAQYDTYHFLQLPLRYQYRFWITQREGGHHAWLGVDAGVYGQLMLVSGTELSTTVWVAENGVTLTPQNDRRTLSGASDRRRPFSGGLNGGITYQADYGFLSYFLRLGAQWDLQQLRREQQEYDAGFLDNLWEYQLVDQNFKLHSIQLTAGLLLPKSHRVKNLRKQ